MKSKRLSILIKKEVKELLRDPKILIVMILVPSLMFVAMGEIFGFTMEKTAEEIQKEVNIAVINLDNDWASQLLIQTIQYSQKTNLTIIKDPGYNVTELSVKGNYNLIIVIPQDFTEKITSNEKAELTLYSIIKGISLTSTIKSSIIEQLIGTFQENLVKNWLKQAFPDKNPDVMLHPLYTEQYAVLKGKEFPVEVIYSFLNQAFLLILGPFIVLSMGAGLAAASIGIEKEEKTLETLLSLPIKRSHILVSKTIGALIVAIVGSIAMGFGLYYYMMKIFSLPSTMGGEVTGGLGVKDVIQLLGTSNLALIGIGFFVSLALVLILSIVIASLTSNVREAQAIAGYIWIPVILPMFLTMYLDLSSMSQATQIGMALLPFTTSIIALKTAFEGQTVLAYISLFSNIGYILIVLLLGAKWFSGEKILTTRLKLGGKKRKKVKWMGILRIKS